MKLNREKIIPHLKQASKLSFFEVQGNSYSAKEFIEKYKNLLSEKEQMIVDYSKDFINDTKIFPIPIANVSEKSELIIAEKKPNFLKKVGSRSAYLKSKKLKFKGCRPVGDDLYFPHEKLDFGDTKMVTTKIPFGVLTVENVMREILAFCFFKKYKLNFLHEPIEVFEYKKGKKIIGYCLLTKSESEERLESQENFLGLTVKDLIILSRIEKEEKIDIFSNVKSFQKISNEWYAENKGQLLADMNFNGGFRGVLNSNLGNDIEYKGGFYICDFDTFVVIEIPQKANYQFIKNFVLWCIIEIIKSSPFVFDYVNLGNIGKKESAKILWDIYTDKSMLWKKYFKKFLEYSRKNGWKEKDVMKAIDETIETEVFYEMILDNVLNSQVIKNTYKPELSFYTKQG